MKKLMPWTYFFFQNIGLSVIIEALNAYEQVAWAAGSLLFQAAHPSLVAASLCTKV